MPEISSTEGITTISRDPTYADMSPEPIVETSTLGTPMGRRCIAAEAIAVPPDPPIPRMPSTRPSANSLPTVRTRPDCITRIASALSLLVRSRSISPPPAAATSRLEMSGANDGFAKHAEVNDDYLEARLVEQAFHKLEITPFRIQAAGDRDRFPARRQKVYRTPN